MIRPGGRQGDTRGKGAVRCPRKGRGEAHAMPPVVLILLASLSPSPASVIGDRHWAPARACSVGASPSPVCALQAASRSFCPEFNPHCHADALPGQPAFGCSGRAILPPHPLRVSHSHQILPSIFPSSAKKGKSPIFNPKLSQESDFQPRTPKPDIMHP